jgi:hypothetical protein
MSRRGPWGRLGRGFFNVGGADGARDQAEAKARVLVSKAALHCVSQGRVEIGLELRLSGKHDVHATSPVPRRTTRRDQKRTRRSARPAAC